jgi:DNA polymerase-3 subunit alpha
MLTRVRMIATKKGDTMLVATLEDENEDTVELVAFPKACEKYRDLLRQDALLIVQAKVEERNGVVQLALERASLVIDDEDAHEEPIPSENETGQRKIAGGNGAHRNGAPTVGAGGNGAHRNGAPTVGAGGNGAHRNGAPTVGAGGNGAPTVGAGGNGAPTVGAGGNGAPTVGAGGNGAHRNGAGGNGAPTVGAGGNGAPTVGAGGNGAPTVGAGGNGAHRNGAFPSKGRTIRLHFQRSSDFDATVRTMVAVNDLLSGRHGDDRVLLTIDATEYRVILHARQNVSCDPDLIAALTAILGDENVSVD